jgi:hypothetical protein
MCMKKISQILTSGIISGDQVAVKRIFSLISRPLNDFNELYYPSFAEWVSCKVYPFHCSSDLFVYTPFLFVIFIIWLTAVH